MRIFLLRRPCGMSCRRSKEPCLKTRLRALEFEVSKFKCACNKTNKKEDHPKSGKSKSDAGPRLSEKKKKARHGKKPCNGGKAKDQVSQVWSARLLCL